MHLCMKHLFYTLIVSLLFLASCGEKPTKQADAPKSVSQREGIQWGEIHFKPMDEYGDTEEATLLYTTADGMVAQRSTALIHNCGPRVTNCGVTCLVFLIGCCRQGT